MLAISSQSRVLVRRSGNTMSNSCVKCLSLLVSPLQELNLVPKFTDLHLPFAARIHASIWLCIYVSSFFICYDVLSNTKAWANSKNLTFLRQVEVNSSKWEYFFKGSSVGFYTLICNDSASWFAINRCLNDTFRCHLFLNFNMTSPQVGVVAVSKICVWSINTTLVIAEDLVSHACWHCL